MINLENLKNSEIHSYFQLFWATKTSRLFGSEAETLVIQI